MGKILTTSSHNDSSAMTESYWHLLKKKNVNEREIFIIKGISERINAENFVPLKGKFSFSKVIKDDILEK